MDDLIQERVTQKENELNATYDEKMRNYEERCVPSYSTGQILMHIAREQDLQRQLALTKNQLRDLRSSNESNQAKLLDHTQRQGAFLAIRREEESFDPICRPGGRSEARRARHDGCRLGAREQSRSYRRAS